MQKQVLVVCVLVLLMSVSVSALVSDCGLFAVALFRGTGTNVPSGAPLITRTQASPAGGGLLAGLVPFFPNGSDPGYIYNFTLPAASAITNGEAVLNILQYSDSDLYFFPNFSIKLNGRYVSATNNGPAQIFQYTPNPAGSFIRLTPFLSGFRNSVIINITSNLTGFGGFVGCDYMWAFNFTNPGGAVVGDPQFVGLRGQSYQVHGIDGAVYNIISDAHAQYNSRFAFLNGPRACPIMPSTGKKSAACWSHAGSYLGEFGVTTSGGDRVEIISGAANVGFQAVTVNGRALNVGDSLPLTHANVSTQGSISRISTHELTVSAGPFDVRLENSDSFINLQSVSVQREGWGRLEAHGLLGQTWRAKRYSGQVKEIEGEVDDYVIAEDSLFGTDFLFNRFTSPIKQE